VGNCKTIIWAYACAGIGFAFTGRSLGIRDELHCDGIRNYIAFESDGLHQAHASIQARSSCIIDLINQYEEPRHGRRQRQKRRWVCCKVAIKKFKLKQARCNYTSENGYHGSIQSYGSICLAPAEHTIECSRKSAMYRALTVYGKHLRRSI